jgi:hypothetical protein
MIRSSGLGKVLIYMCLSVHARTKPPLAPLTADATRFTGTDRAPRHQHPGAWSRVGGMAEVQYGDVATSARYGRVPSLWDSSGSQPVLASAPMVPRPGGFPPSAFHPQATRCLPGGVDACFRRSSAIVAPQINSKFRGILDPPPDSCMPSDKSSASINSSTLRACPERRCLGWVSAPPQQCCDPRSLQSWPHGRRPPSELGGRLRLSGGSLRRSRSVGTPAVTNPSST